MVSRKKPRKSSDNPNKQLPEKTSAANRINPITGGSRPMENSILKPAVKTRTLNTFIVGNCAESTNVNDINTLLSSKKLTPFSVVELKAREGGRKRFLIKTTDDCSKFMDPNAWPTGVHCSQRNQPNNTPLKVWGKCEESTTIHISGQPNSKIYIGGCDPSMTEGDVKSHLLGLGVQVIDIKNISIFTTRQDAVHKAFIIESARTTDNVLLDGNSWPEGIRFWRFRYRPTITTTAHKDTES